MVATLAYRGAKVLKAAPAGFEDFRAGEGARSAGVILAHIGDLLDWTASFLSGKQAWRDSQPLAWDKECERFFAGLATVDKALAEGPKVEVSIERLFQGPLADAFTHIGQLALMRRMAGAPVKGENFFVADVAIGRVGAEQAAPKKSF
jgi:hypothetical protein